MISKVGIGWQTTIADLALILFAITASAVKSPGAAKSPQTSANVPSLSRWNSSTDGIDFEDWLATQQADPRATLVITAHYSPSQRGELWETANKNEETARIHFQQVRTVLAPAIKTSLSAVVVYDGQLGE
jgi:hypothetical protein